MNDLLIIAFLVNCTQGLLVPQVSSPGGVQSPAIYRCSGSRSGISRNHDANISAGQFAIDARRHFLSMPARVPYIEALPKGRPPRRGAFYKTIGSNHELAI